MKTIRYIVVVIFLLNMLISLLSAQIGVPTLNNPQNNDEYYFIAPANFDWSFADSAEFYEIIIDDAADFESPVFNESVAYTSVETNDLFNNWKFYWKVRAGRDSSGIEIFGEWSDIFTFTSEYTPPTNQTPSDGSFDEDYAEIHFFWDIGLAPSVESGNNTYQFQLATDSEFETLIRDTEVATEKNTQIADLQPGTTYYWRVKYSNDYGESGWSDVTNFQTSNAELEQVALIEPEDNVVNINPLDVRFTWQEVGGADSYMFELAEDSSFTQLIESASIDTTFYTTNIYLYEVKLFWRVQALGGDAAGPWSDIWRLTTKTNTGLSEEAHIAHSLFLEQNYPNPFNPTTTISFSLPERSYVNVEIFNMVGRRIKTLYHSVLNKGVHNTVWNARDEFNMQVPSGQYFYVLKVKNTKSGLNRILVKKMLLIK